LSKVRMAQRPNLLKNDHGVENRAKGSLVTGCGPQADNMKILKHDAQLS
jgi:hypothetical protein